MDEELAKVLCPECRDVGPLCEECLKKYRAFMSALHYKAHPEQRRAQRCVQRAIKTGKIVKQPCAVCGTTEDVHAHHEDYDKPLDVVWLCRSHHGVANLKRSTEERKVASHTPVSDHENRDELGTAAALGKADLNTRKGVNR